MTQILFVAATNDPRNTQNFSNLPGAIDTTTGNPATANSFASGGTTFRGIVLDLGADTLVHSITARLNQSGNGGFGGWNPEYSVAAAPTTWISMPGTQAGSGPDKTWTPTGAPITARYISLSARQSGLAFRPWLEIDAAFADGDAVPTPPPPDPLPAIHVAIDGVEFVGLREQTIRVALNDAGSFFFAINRADEQATEANIYRGAIVQVTIPQIHDTVLWEGIIESGDFDVCR